MVGREERKAQIVLGEKIKKKAMSAMVLYPKERDFYNSVPVLGVSQEALNKLNPRYDAPALSIDDEIYMREKFPYNPPLRFGNIKKLPMYMTDKDTLAHEMQHQYAYREGKKDTEQLASRYSEEVSGRISDKPNKVTPLNSALMELLKKKGYL